MGNVQISTSVVPQGTCPEWIIERWPELVALLSANLNGSLNVFNDGNSVPAPADQSKPWYRSNVDGTPDRWYRYSGGSWISRHPQIPGLIAPWEGDISTVDTLDGGEVAAVTATTGPMWQRVTELNAKFPIGIGTLPGGTVLAVGSTGGEENHILITSEMPRHAHVLRCDTKMELGSDVRRARNNDATNNDADVATDFAGGDQPHNTMPPYYALNWIRRTGRIFYRL